MTELVDNLTQLLAALSGCVLSGALYLRSRGQPYFLLCCFYGCFGMGLLYWLLYTLLVTDAPPMFYVSDIGWISCFIFLLLLQYSLVDPPAAAQGPRPAGRGAAVPQPGAMARAGGGNTADGIFCQHRRRVL